MRAPGVGYLPLLVAAEANAAPPARTGSETTSATQKIPRYNFGLSSEHRGPTSLIGYPRQTYKPAAMKIGARTSVVICMRKAVLLYGYLADHARPTQPVSSISAYAARRYDVQRRFWIDRTRWPMKRMVKRTEKATPGAEVGDVAVGIAKAGNEGFAAV